MQKKLRYFIPGMVSLVIITCLALYPVAATSPALVTGPGYTTLNIVQSTDPSKLSDLMSHAVSTYNANPDKFSVLNSTAYSIPADNFAALDGVFSVPTYSFSGLDGSSSASDTFTALDGPFTVPTYSFSGLDGSSGPAISLSDPSFG